MDSGRPHGSGSTMKGGLGQGEWRCGQFLPVQMQSNQRVTKEHSRSSCHGFGISTFLTNTFLHQVHSLRGCRVPFLKSGMNGSYHCSPNLNWDWLSNPTHILGYLL